MSHRLKLISIHVPKSGGTSFGKSLSEIYGLKHVQTAYVDRALRQRLEVNVSARVLHGHINIKDYKNLLCDYPAFVNLPIVTWIRNPVERVISEYYYMRQILEAQLKPHEHETPTLKNRMVRSIDEFALHHGSRNAFSRFIDLNDVKSGKYAFIGEVEDYSRDFQKMSTKFEWPASASPHYVNRTKIKPEIGDELRKKLVDLNQHDMELYDHILSNKQKINS